MERQDGSSEGLISSSFVVFGVCVSVILCNFLIKEILRSEAVLLSTEMERVIKMEGSSLCQPSLRKQSSVIIAAFHPSQQKQRISALV